MPLRLLLIGVALLVGCDRTIRFEPTPTPTPAIDPACDDDGDGALDPACGGDDCDDEDPTRHPGAASACDGLDSDCNGAPDPDEADADGDGYSVCLDDCDDDDPAVRPNAVETCAPGDENCNGDIDAIHQDFDDDGVSPCDGDCDDFDPTLHAGAPELCNGRDDDCDEQVPVDETDADGDGVIGCEDCDDADPDVFPGAPEWCNDRDDNCDGVADEDADSDGYTACDGDCRPELPLVHPGAFDDCDGYDSDCDGVVDDVYLAVPSEFATGDEAVAAYTGSIFDVVCFAPGDHAPVSVPGMEIWLQGATEDARIVGGTAPAAVAVAAGGVVHLDGLQIIGGEVGVDAPQAAVELLGARVRSSVGDGVVAQSLHAQAATIEDVGGSAAVVGTLTGHGLGIEGVGGIPAVAVTSSLNLNGLELHGSVGLGLELTGSGAMSLDDCAFADTAGPAIQAVGLPNLGVTNCSFDRAQQHALDLHDVGAAYVQRVRIAGAGLGVPEGSAITASATDLEVRWAQIVDVTGSALLLLEGADAEVHHATVVGTGGEAFDAIHSDLLLTGSIVVDAALGVRQVGDGAATVLESFLPAADATGDVFGGWSIDDPGLLDLAGDPADWRLQLQAGANAVNAAPSSLADGDGSPADAGAYGSLVLPWDVDFDGAHDWWQPGGWPGPPWDCDDRDPDAQSGC